MMNKLILIDQDGVLADFEQGIKDGYQARFGCCLPVLPKGREHFYLAHDYPMLRDNLHDIYTTQGFFEHLPPIEGAIDALKILLSAGLDVRICTSPINHYRHCVSEKFAWVERHLGVEWTHRIILTKDKTWVRGDVLIDDKPVITGSLVPTWQHWLYTHSYNQAVDNGNPRVTWLDTQSWQSLLNV